MKVNISQAASFLKAEDLTKAWEKALNGYQKVKNANGEGSEWLGWRHMLAHPNDAELERIDTLANRLRDEIDIFIVCGIGGSYLGAKALIEALTPHFKKEKDPEIIFAGHHLDGGYLADLIHYLEAPKPDGTPKKVAINAISKSGTTLETALSFRVLRHWLHEHFPVKAAKRIICTTSSSGGVLNALADEKGYQRFIIPDDVGGRFSVLTPVGLLPAAVAGIDIRALFYGAVSKYEELEQHADELLDYASVRYALGKAGKSIDLFTSFEPGFSGLAGWLQQLLGESEGKQGKGMFPATAGYSTDLHSLGQFVQEGNPVILETFIAVERGKDSVKIEKAEEDIDKLNYLSGLTFKEINQQALEGTRQAHIKGGVPCITLLIKEKNAQSLGEFIYFFELFTAVYCYMLQVNPFDQPGVEAYKKEIYKRLGKK